MSELEHRWEKVFPDSGEACPDTGATLATPAAKRILLVEDDLTTSIVMTQLLLRLGYQVQTADSLASAMHLIAQTPVDIVLCDIGLPDGSGYDLMTQLRNRCDAVGIAMTGYDEQDDLERSQRAGFTNHLVKPVDFDALKTILAQVRSL